MGKHDPFCVPPSTGLTKSSQTQGHRLGGWAAPLLVEKFDDKEFVNNRLRANGSFAMPWGWTVSLSTDPRSFLQKQNLPFPIVGKPIRGRGSQGVKVCYSLEELYDHLQLLSGYSPTVMLEGFLSREEATVTVMPPALEVPRYWAMPVVTRFNHDNGVAPYNGAVAVTANSRAVGPQEIKKDYRYMEASTQCEEVAKLMQATAALRVDIRRYNQDPGAPFALFDINMKPVSPMRLIPNIFCHVPAFDREGVTK